MPAPSLVRPATPEITPSKPTAEATVSVRVVAPRSIRPAKERAPLFVASPSVASPPSVRALAKARALLSVEERTPLFSVSVPMPKAASSPASAVPSPRVKPPPKVLAPESVSTPAVVFVALPPARTAETVPASKA